ncbi:isochorismate synthase MenF [Bacillus inaquosorum]|uniref:isochorismate synthase n=1 Tax=Bacillus inaquosorum TaxID=483913 RepID=UPI0022820744|nr:isochorismate synthase MenF [Bacillus inaquosorum]MCY7756843.1 isochorismate synthase MenF [Bacillus inaquosorum]MCY7950071.1 isochorismate synthase MenF [Bacillus inaquosorum]MCY8731878.1 isochorismate synthase MenF [Bacillus inaquosorum]MCY9274109.1 isochorismate synthase MenF [Bacillus inaquosorum]MEC0605790.1 isochorismate synthase MenF [Bacillus inaquosorum]
MVTTVQRTFRKEVLHALHKAKEVNHAVLISYSRQIESLDPLSFFNYGAKKYTGNRFFWSDPESELTIVGLGKEAVFQTSQKNSERYREVFEQWERFKKTAFHIYEEEKLQHSAVGPVLFGGFSFDPCEERGTQWDHFSEGDFFVPALMLTMTAEGPFLTVNRWVSEEEDAEAVLEGLKAFAAEFMVPVPVLEQGDQAAIAASQELDKDNWLKAIETATSQIKEKQYDKVVLARELLLTFDGPVQIEPMLKTLLNDQQTSYVFAIEQEGQTFVGASPERLIKRDGSTVMSSCLAGSIKRGADEEEDRRIGLELLNDEKNLLEHDIVVGMIHNAFISSCSEVEKPDGPALYKTKSVQHLFTPIVGQLRESASLFDLIEKLHPTPALGGAPQKKAVEVIRKIEPMSRGWYAAPIGWIDSQDNGEFAVAIRSGLIEGSTARLFAGCGIVEDSDPQLEYEETQIKLKPMISALGGERR